MADGVLEAEEVTDLTLDLLSARNHQELEEFVKKLSRRVSRAARTAGKAVGRTAIARQVVRASKTKLARSIRKAARDVGRGIAKAGAAVPIASTLAKLASRSPLGALARSTYGALSAALRGKNILMGALDGLAGTPAFGALIQLGRGVLRGDNVLKAMKMAVKAGIADAREALRLAAMVAPFVPGIGTGIGAALGAADALANGQPITQALIAGVRGAIPGGAFAQAAFDTAAQLAQGKRLDQALLTAARNRLPPGPAQAAFDAGLAIAQGKKLQDAALQAAGRLLPPSPFAADLKTFAQRALAGQNLGHAALSTAGQAVLGRVKQQGGDFVATVQGRAVAAVAPVAAKAHAAATAPAVRAAAAPMPRPPVTLDRMIAASGLADRRHADRFMVALGAAS